MSADLAILTEDLPPYNYMENGTLTGATTHVVQEITRRLGISPDIQVLPWARGYQRLRSEPNVVLFTTAHTKERDPQFHWVGPLYVSRLEFYARKGTLRRLDSLDEARQALGKVGDDNPRLRSALARPLASPVDVCVIFCSGPSTQITGLDIGQICCVPIPIELGSRRS